MRMIFFRTVVFIKAVYLNPIIHPHTPGRASRKEEGELVFRFWATHQLTRQAGVWSFRMMCWLVLA